MNLENFYSKLKSIFGFNDKEETPKLSGDIYFLSIGIDKYKKEKNLSYCYDDSEEFINLWRINSRYRIKTKNIYTLYDSEATKINIISNLEKLTNLMKYEDQLIIHLAGHGFDSIHTHFFIPFDGERDNIYSCISNHTINSFIKDNAAKQVLFILNTNQTFNINTSKATSTNDKWQVLLKDYYKTGAFQDSESNFDNIFIKLTKFLNQNETNRKKEIFLFVRTNNNKANKEAVLGEWQHDDSVLQLRIKKQHERIIKYIKEDKLDEALDSIEHIVENNNIQLNYKVQALKYKLNETKVIQETIKKNSTAETKIETTKKNIYVQKKVVGSKNDKIIKFDENIDLVKTKNEITELSKGVVEEINNCGFYLVRLPENNNMIKLASANRKIILFASADPQDQSRLRLDDEFRSIQYEIMRAKYRDDFELIPCLASRIGDFQRSLLDSKPHIIHFSGHGTCSGICLIGNDEGNTDVVENQPLADLFKLFSKYIDCVFLNSCHSINQSNLISNHISKVICMKNSVDDKTAIHFAKSFYASLASGQDIDFSFEFAKNSINLHKLIGSDIPELLSKS